MRSLLNHHATHGHREVLCISTEILPFADYGAGVRYSLFEDSIACARWLRTTWNEVRMNASANSEAHAAIH
jgi:hypothetical protein